MGKRTEVIIAEVEQFKTEYGGDYPDYYIGITKDIEQRLIEQNGSMQEHLNAGRYTEGNSLYTAECLNRDEAVEIEQHFQQKGMEKYNPGAKGVEEPKYIYCFKMTVENKDKILYGNSAAGRETARLIKTFKDFKK